MSAASALTPRELRLADAIAERVAERLQPTETLRQPARLVDAATVAAALGISRDCVYAHAAELGGERIGGGPRGRLRFDLDKTLIAWTSRSRNERSSGEEMPAQSQVPQRTKPVCLGSTSGLLPIRGRLVTSGTDERRA